MLEEGDAERVYPELNLEGAPLIVASNGKKL